MNKILVTGAAGFIGFHFSRKLIERGLDIIGIDNLNDYYDVNLKKARLARLEDSLNFRFVKMDLSDRDAMAGFFAKEDFDCVVNLAAQPGVRYSLVNPHAYIDCNITGFLNVLEGCRDGKVRHLVFASSSSVYGANAKMPFSVHQNVDHPVSLYGATKKSDELMAHAYASLYGIPCTGLRFFTVYGPWGRPDMAYFLFTEAIMEGRPIDVFNHGKMKRDFTYIDDITEGMTRIVSKIPSPDSLWDAENPDAATSYAPYRIYNVGNNNAVDLMRFIEVLEKFLGKKALKNYLPMQAGDVNSTYANIDDLFEDVGFRPSTSIEEGLEKFVHWYKSYKTGNAV